MRLVRHAAIIAAMAFSMWPPLHAQGSASEYLSSANLFGSSRILVARLEMHILRKGSEQKREIELSLDRSGSGAKSLARILSPSFLSGLKFLKLSVPGQPDAAWIKTSRGLRRLAETSGAEAVFDSDFTTEDFGTIGSAGFELSFAPSRDAGSERAIEARPRGAAPYALRILYIDDATKLLMGMDYLDAAGKLIKRYRVTSLTGSGEDARPASALMEDLRTGGSTRLDLLSLRKPDSLPERTFNAASL